MKKSISSVSFELNNLLVQVTIPDKKVVMLRDFLGESERIACLSAIERALAMDFTDYYDKFDASHGFSYGKINRVRLSFSDGENIVYSGSDLSVTDTNSKFCVRQVSSGFIRSFSTGDLEGKVESAPSNIGVNMTSYNGSVSEKTWLYIETVVNQVIGYKYVSVDIAGRKIAFNSDVQNQEYCKGIYLLFAEIIALGEGRAVPLYVLISGQQEVGKFGFGDVSSMPRVLNALENLRYDCQVFLV